jgi:hypothetical protein
MLSGTHRQHNQTIPTIRKGSGDHHAKRRQEAKAEEKEGMPASRKKKKNSKQVL